MAAVTHRVATASTSNASSYASGSFTPAVNDLLVGKVVASGTQALDATLTDSVGGTWTLISTARKGTSTDMCYVYVRTALIASAVAMTVTFTCTSDAATGAVVIVSSVSGMTRTGAAAVRQFDIEENRGATTPACTFPAACLTGNPVIGVVGNGANPATLTPPTGWTEGVDTGFTTPACGAESAFINSGFTGTVVTWGSASGSVWGAIVIELDTSSPTVDLDATSAGSSTLAGPLSAIQALSSTINGVATVAAPLTGLRLLPASTINGVGALSGTLIGVRLLPTSTINGVGLLNGTLLGLGILSTTINGVGILTGVLRGERLLSPITIVGVGSLTGTLRGLVDLGSVTINGIGILSGALTLRQALTALSQGQGLLLGDLTAFGQSFVNLTGTAAGVGALAGPLQGLRLVTGSAAGLGSLTGSLAGLRLLTALSGGVATLDASLASLVALLARSDGLGTLDGSPSAIVALDAILSGTSVLGGLMGQTFFRTILAILDQSHPRFGLQDRSHPRHTFLTVSEPKVLT